nr:hypothetical protein GCM10020185_28840 [Pseudomonas brassicacearum subsp. brassicacearum]
MQNNDWTRRKLLEQHALGGRYITVVGSPEQVADELESWIAETGLDGFNLTRIVTPQSYVDFIDLVVPELQRRGSYKTEYDNGTLREKNCFTHRPISPSNTPVRLTGTDVGARHCGSKACSRCRHLAFFERPHQLHRGQALLPHSSVRQKNMHLLLNDWNN